MKLIIDAMGGDNAPQAPVEAGARAARELGINIVLVGKEQVLKNELSRYTYPEDKLEIVNADEVITNHEEPVKAVKTKKNSSLVVAARMLRNKEGDAMRAMGNTGPLLAAGLLIVGRIRGILRPALATLLPTENGPKLLLDAGANTNCKPENLVQFAVMGSIYMKNVMSVEMPSVGLMSIGEEEGKGDDLTKKTFSKLKSAPINFYGNIEGRDVMLGTTDVMVCDGFVGNVVLKTVEGMGSFLGKSLKRMFLKNAVTKIGALCLSSGVKELKQLIDYREYGGAPLLGVRSTVIKGHGSSDAKAVFSAIKQAKKAVETNIVEEIKSSLTKIDLSEKKEEI
ncbi:MAG: phosphate acyltransferase PlsX [Firmicutes bacterium]|nr:phosphate acyltransferase PlsX [Bacillota bacterium]